MFFPSFISTFHFWSKSVLNFVQYDLYYSRPDLFYNLIIHISKTLPGAPRRLLRRDVITWLINEVETTATFIWLSFLFISQNQSRLSRFGPRMSRGHVQGKSWSGHVFLQIGIGWWKGKEGNQGAANVFSFAPTSHHPTLEWYFFVKEFDCDAFSSKKKWISDYLWHFLLGCSILRGLFKNLLPVLTYSFSQLSNKTKT